MLDFLRIPQRLTGYRRSLKGWEFRPEGPSFASNNLLRRYLYTGAPKSCQTKSNGTLHKYDRGLSDYIFKLCRLTTADQPNGQSGFINADSVICRSQNADVNSFTSEYYQFIVICPDIHDLRASTLDRATTDLSGQDLYIDSDRTISSYLLHEFLHYENDNFSKPARYDSSIN
jgi:hypothetical protein